MKIPDFIGGGSEIGYESPITLIAGELETKMENDTMQVIQRYGIEVDKEELLKALQYDRDQYDKGYLNGHIDGVAQAERMYARPIGTWIRGKASFGYVDLECSLCHCECECVEDDKIPSKYCPNCGAKMEGDAE